MCKGRMMQLIICSTALFFLLATVPGLQAQSYTVYPLRDASGSIVSSEAGGDYDLLADGSGNLHILWSQGGYIYYGRLVYSALSGEYYLSGQEYTGVNFYQDGVSSWWTQPRACVRRDGQTVHFVWGESLKHAWRNAQGVWSKETVRSISGIQRCIAPSVVVEDNETVHVLYGYYDGSNGYDPTHLIYQRKPAGGSWSGTMEFDVVGYNQGAEWRNPVMTLDAQGGIHATWCNYMFWTTADGGAARYRYAPAGTGLEAVSTVIIPRAADVYTNGAGNIFVDPTGKVHRTMSTSLVSLEYSSKPSGASGVWAAPSRPSNGLMQTDEDSWAGVITDSCGRVLVAYGDGADYSNYPYLYLSVLDQGVWNRYTVSTSAGLGCFRQPSLVSGAGTLFMLWRESSGRLYIATVPDSCGSLAITSPNGGESWVVGESRDIIWTSTGTVGKVNIDYSTNSGATWTAIVSSTANDGLHPWTVPNTPSSTCLLRVQEVDGSPTGTSNTVFSIIANAAETVTTPTTPTGPASGSIGASYAYASGGSLSSLGHAIQYKLDWGDGTDSGWLTVGVTTASHIWAAAGTYNVRAMARCATDTTIVSLWSVTRAVTIRDCVPNGKDDLLATWDGQGVYYRNSDSGGWVNLATSATLVTVGDLDNDCVDDLIGIWPYQGGVWVKYSKTGAWAKLSTTARHIATGDMNGDGRPELLGTWDGQGVYWRNNTSGAWTKLATPATLITSGDLDGDGTDDLIGIWLSQDGVWVKYSQTGAWAKLSTTAVDISAGDMNGDGRDDLLATWDGQGVYYRNSINGAWVKMATPATQVTAGDLDGDGTDDVIGIWPGQGGVWVKYSQTGAWAKLSSTAVDIAAGKMRAAGSASLAEPGATVTGSEGDWGPDAGADVLDLSANAPGGMNFACPDGENLEPREFSNALYIPGPGELGFLCLEQKNLVPGSGIKKQPRDKK